MPPLAAALLTIAAALALAAPASGALRLQKVADFDSPIFVTGAPDDYSRLYVAERDGTIRVVRNGVKLGTPFADLRSVVDTSGERGLLSIAFPPDFQSSRLVYAYYADADGDVHVDQLHAPSADRADPGYRRVTIEISTSSGNHKGGTAAFGPDGYLYLAPGDGTNGDEAQNLSSLLGKVLRIAPRRGGGYAVPSGNPYGNAVWARGLRNPFRFSFDRGTGDLVIGDVGAQTTEEIDFAPSSAGRGRGWNYGWPQCEGSYTQGSTSNPCPVGERPVIDKFQPDWTTINAGVVVRDPSLPSLHGRFLYADSASGMLYSARLRRPRAAEDRSLGFRLYGVVGIAEDAAGCVYGASLDGGVYRFVENNTVVPCPRPPPGADRVPPRLRVRVPRRQRVRRRRGAIGYARCSETCRVSMSGALRIGRRSYKLRKTTRRVRAHRRLRLRVRLTRRASRALRRALRRRRRARVRVAFRARDGARNRSVLIKRTVRVRR
jgi:glucose/arabinose dehydrogenase